MHCTAHILVPIADRQADRNRRPVGLAGHVHDAAHALRGQVETAAPPSTSGLTRRVSALSFDGATQIA
jgi:hypothetical protein